MTQEGKLTVRTYLLDTRYTSRLPIAAHDALHSVYSVHRADLGRNPPFGESVVVGALQEAVFHSTLRGYNHNLLFYPLVRVCTPCKVYSPCAGSPVYTRTPPSFKDTLVPYRTRPLTTTAPFLSVGPPLSSLQQWFIHRPSSDRTTYRCGCDIPGILYTAVFRLAL